MTDKERYTCRLVVALLDESQELHQMAKWLLENDRGPIQATLGLGGLMRCQSNMPVRNFTSEN